MFRRRIAAFIPAVVAAACNHGMPDGPSNSGPYPYTSIAAPPNGLAQFTVLPVAPAPGLTLTALGNLNPPGHVLPTDHVYFYAWDLATGQQTGGTSPRNVYMPTTGALFLVIQRPQDSKLMFRATETFYFYLDHVVPTLTMKVGDVIPAGTLIGTTDPGGTLDLGAFDQSVTHTGFINPDRYPFQTLYYVSPWEYFTPALQASLYPQIYRAPTAPDRDGKIDFSVPGELVGDWFLQGMPVDSSWDSYGWSRTVSFVYDYYDPSQVRISIGGTVDSAGVWAIDSTATRPENVTPASGIVSYRLLSPFDWHPQHGLMLVQMVSPSQIMVEVFPGSTVTTAQFDARAVTFVR